VPNKAKKESESKIPQLKSCSLARGPESFHQYPSLLPIEFRSRLRAIVGRSSNPQRCISLLRTRFFDSHTQVRTPCITPSSPQIAAQIASAPIPPATPAPNQPPAIPPQISPSPSRSPCPLRRLDDGAYQKLLHSRYCIGVYGDQPAGPTASCVVKRGDGGQGNRFAVDPTERIPSATAPRRSSWILTQAVVLFFYAAKVICLQT
jgi:hypothetical protein